MTPKQAIEVMFREWKCIDRNDGVHCDRQCEKCDLVMKVSELRDAFNQAISALQAQDKQQWIPVSERLPKVAHSVLFSRRSMATREGCLQADGKWWQYRWNEILNADQVTAWKPLPEPYREEDDDE